MEFSNFERTVRYIVPFWSRIVASSRVVFGFRRFGWLHITDPRPTDTTCYRDNLFVREAPSVPIPNIPRFGIEFTQTEREKAEEEVAELSEHAQYRIVNLAFESLQNYRRR